MSDIAQGPGWWLASDGKWYPPRDESQAPAPGWWLASDGKWYPPMESEEPPEADWWLASDGKWYPPDRKPGTRAQPGAPAPTWATPEGSPWAPIDPGREPSAPVKPVPAAPSRGSGSSGRPPVKPIPAPGRPPAAVREPAPTPKPPAGPPPPIANRPPAPAAGPPPMAGPPRDPGANRPQPAAPPAAPPAPPATRPPVGPITRPTRASDLEGHDDHDDSGRSPLDQKRAQDEQSKKDAAVLIDARRQAAMRALGSLGVLKAEGEPAAPAPPAPPPPKGDSGGTASERPAAPGGAAPLLEIIPSQVIADDARTATRVSIYAEHIELRNRANEVVRRIAITDITNVAVSKRFTGTSVTIESKGGAPVVARGLRPDQADDVRSRLLTRRAPGAAGFMEAPAPPTEIGAAPEPVVADPPPPPAADTGGNDTEVHLDESDLLAKLAALRDAGVLTEAEHDEKVELVTRLIRGESLAVTTAPGA